MSSAAGAERRGGEWAVRLAIFALFIASGAAGLIYEVVWSRLLTQVFGATLLAVSTVLASFMGGLALGSALLGAASDRMRRPLRFYAFLELGIAAGSLLVPLLLRLLENAAAPVLGNFAIAFAVRNLVLFCVTFIVLLVPTTLMGATLPVLSRFLVHRRESLGLNVGGLYSANTFGAVVGTFLTGFVVIAAWGVWGAAASAAALNVAVFVAAWALSNRVETTASAEAPSAPSIRSIPSTPSTPSTPSPSSTSPRLYRIALATYAVAGFSSLSFQVVWTRGLVFCSDVLQSSTYSFTTMLTVFLAGLALGGATMTGRVDRHRRPARLYGLLLLALGILGGLSGILMFNIAPAWAPFEARFVPEGHNTPFLIATLDLFAKAALVLFLPTFVMGMTFPTAARLCVPDLKRVGGGVGRLYACNTVGAILGAFAAGFVLIPLFGMSHTALILSCLYMLMALVVFRADPDSSRFQRVAMAAVAIAAVALFAVRLPSRDQTFRNTVPKLTSILAWDEGPLATVSVTEDSLGDREIAIDGVGVAGTNRVMLTDQKSLAHLPSLVLAQPRAALTVGFGSGGASYSYTLYPEYEAVHCVEIAENVLKPSIQRLLEGSNHGLLDWLFRVPQYATIHADARSYLRFARQRYDVIATDCTDLRYKSNANLYDLQYFQLCRERLTPDGMVVVWMPLGGLSADLFLTVLNTFHRVFPDSMHVWYFNNDTTHYCLLAGFQRADAKIDYARLARRIARPEIAADLGEIDLADPDKLLGCYVTGGPHMAEILAGRRLNTESHPVVEFEAPRAPYDIALIWENLQTLYANRQSVLELIDPTTLPAEHRERIQRFEQAAPIIAKGHAANAQGDYFTATKFYEEARRLTPDDRALAYVASFPPAQRAFNSSADKIFPAVRLGMAEFARAELGRGDYNRAIEYFTYVLRLGPEAPGVLGTAAERRHAYLLAAVYTGRALWRLARKDEALQILNVAKKNKADSDAVIQFEKEVQDGATP
ncbi:MAG: fused MFS/spermidine synthase [Candidatus Sumerlaeota bacterium]|nr:fused MFS/spermidine synthase [Candidatus Sumerlaeota bacterium]